jgi:hypothetical protein
MTVTAVPSRPLLHPLPARPAEAAPGALRHPEPNRDLPPGTGVFFCPSFGKALYKFRHVTYYFSIKISLPEMQDGFASSACLLRRFCPIVWRRNPKRESAELDTGLNRTQGVQGNG